MSTTLRIFFVPVAFALISSCAGNRNNGVRAEIKTTDGDIVIALSDLTPQHRDNFVKLAESGFYDGITFHRVIKDFMIQAGDGTTRNDTSLIAEDYTIPAEINDSLYHKRGAVAAARMGDDVNPDRNSSGTQFYIVQGKVYNDRELAGTIERIDFNRRQYLYNKALNELRTEAKNSTHPMNENEIQQNAIIKAYEQIEKQGAYQMPESRKEVYKTIGGAPFLDGAYTVFGEVIDGMDVVDAIAATQTDASDRPVKDIRILKVKIIK